jgi:3-oxoacyl-[acyl-carrier-protein] synthase II
MLACHVTIVHDAQAPSNTITCGEASSHLAIGEAYRTVARGDADVCVCGGAESKTNPMAMARPLLLRRLNTQDNGAPHQACRPFGAGRAGGVAAEGGGLVIVEALEHAKFRGGRIYAEIVGFGSSSDSRSWSEPDSQGRAMQSAMRKALADANTEVSAMDLVAPFGTGIAEYDAAEMAAWNAVFGERLTTVPAIMIRGAVGNNGAGSGAIDFAATVMALHRQSVPASLNTDQPDPACRFRFVQEDPIDARIGQAISVGPALSGGQNAALVLRRFVE